MNHETAESLIDHGAPAWPARWRWRGSEPLVRYVDTISNRFDDFGLTLGIRHHGIYEIEWSERAVRFRLFKDSTTPAYRVVIVPVVGLDGSEPDCIVIDDHEGLVRYGLVVLTREIA